VSRRAAALVAVLLATAACTRTKQVREEEKPEEKAPDAQRRGAGIPAERGRPPVPAAPQGLLEKGVVARIQRALADRGLLKHHREGELDPPTTAAIRRLQTQDGLAATGFPDRETLKNLGIDPEHAYVREEDRKRQEGERGEEPREREGGPAQRR
jgi:peptidoglycan hydrolase-like protein with peptidoglycan-binding domain